MKLDITFFATDILNIELLKNENDFIEHFVFTDEDGYLSIESGGFLNSLKEVNLLINLLFTNNNLPLELYHDSQTKILDITTLKKDVITSENLDSIYPDWIEETKKQNTMDEYGMLLCYISYVKKNIGKKYLLLIIRNEQQL